MTEKLLPCPFCGGEAAERDIKEPAVNGWVGCQKCRCFMDWVKAGKSLAIAAWNRRVQPENKPLTLDELRQMDGEPVWTVTNGVDGSGRWEIIEYVTEYVVGEFIRLCNPADLTYDCPVDSYGKTWVAYDQPPKEDE